MSYAEDRAAIEELLARYVRGCDERDWPAVESCFTADARAEYSGVRLPPGVDHIVAHLAPLARLAASQHVIGSVSIRVAGDTATAGWYAVAHLVRAVAGGHEVVHRGLSYRDCLKRTGDGWRIRDRVHAVVWSTRTPTTWPVRRFSA